MYTRSIAELFSKFKTGDRPSQEDFRNLIFSLNSPNYIGELKFINNNFNGKLNFFSPEWILLPTLSASSEEVTNVQTYSVLKAIPWQSLVQSPCAAYFDVYVYSGGLPFGAIINQFQADALALSGFQLISNDYATTLALFNCEREPSQSFTEYQLTFDPAEVLSSNYGWTVGTSTVPPSSDSSFNKIITLFKNNSVNTLSAGTYIYEEGDGSLLVTYARKFSATNNFANDLDEYINSGTGNKFANTYESYYTILSTAELLYAYTGEIDTPYKVLDTPFILSASYTIVSYLTSTGETIGRWYPQNSLSEPIYVLKSNQALLQEEWATLFINRRTALNSIPFSYNINEMTYPFYSAGMFQYGTFFFYRTAAGNANYLEQSFNFGYEDGPIMQGLSGGKYTLWGTTLSTSKIVFNHSMMSNLTATRTFNLSTFIIPADDEDAINTSYYVTITDIPSAYYSSVYHVVSARFPTYISQGLYELGVNDNKAAFRTLTAVRSVIDYSYLNAKFDKRYNDTTEVSYPKLTFFGTADYDRMDARGLGYENQTGPFDFSEAFYNETLTNCISGEISLSAFINFTQPTTSVGVANQYMLLSEYTFPSYQISKIIELRDGLVNIAANNNLVGASNRVELLTAISLFNDLNDIYSLRQSVTLSVPVTTNTATGLLFANKGIYPYLYANLYNNNDEFISDLPYNFNINTYQINDTGFTNSNIKTYMYAGPQGTFVQDLSSPTLSAVLGFNGGCINSEVSGKSITLYVSPYISISGTTINPYMSSTKIHIKRDILPSSYQDIEPFTLGFYTSLSSLSSLHSEFNIIPSTASVLNDIEAIVDPFSYTDTSTAYSPDLAPVAQAYYVTTSAYNINDGDILNNYYFFGDPDKFNVPQGTVVTASGSYVSLIEYSKSDTTYKIDFDGYLGYKPITIFFIQPKERTLITSVLHQSY